MVTCADPAQRGTPGCAPYRKWSTMGAVGWPTLIAGWTVAAAISGAAFQKDSKGGAVGLIPVIGAPISAGAGEWTIGARLGLVASGVVQIAGLALGIVGAVNARRTVNPKVGVGPLGLQLRF